MICARVVGNNRDDVEVDGQQLFCIMQVLNPDSTTGDIVVLALDMALDPVTIRVPFGSRLEVYH